MREEIYSLLTGSAPLVDLVSYRIYPVNVQDTKPPVPYIVYKIGVSTPRIVPAQSSNFQVWAHDDRGDYAVIDQILSEVKKALITEENPNYFAIRWLDDSEDLYDESSVTITRYSRFDMVRSLEGA